MNPGCRRSPDQAAVAGHNDLDSSDGNSAWLSGFVLECVLASVSESLLQWLSRLHPELVS